MSASVTPSSVTGKITFFDGVSILGVIPVAGGTATMTTNLLGTGSHSIRAFYSGDAFNAAASTTPTTVTVTSLPSLGLNLPVAYLADSSSVLVRATAVGDFNGDGKPDLVTVDDSKVGVLLGAGDGTYNSFTSYDSAGTAGSVAVGDLNMDGKQDLVVAGSNGVIVWFGNGDGTFSGKTTIYTAIAGSVLIADFNGDGKPDLAYVAAYGNQIQILLGKGDGTFQSAVGASGLYNFSTLQAGDFNGDGRTDLVAGGSYYSISIFLGNGDGTFHPASYLNASSYANAFAVADLDGDGKLDLVYGDVYSNNWVQLGNGDGTFQAGIRLPNLSQINSLRVGDVNGDGISDLIAATNSGVYVFQGTGGVSFGAPVFYSISNLGFGLTLGDFNGDGKLDVAIGGSDGKVRIMLGGAVPDLTVAVTHGSGFTQNQTGAYYKLVVTNTGAVPTSSPVGLTNHLPGNFVATAISGPGWTCTLSTQTCTRSDSLAGGASYPAVLVIVNVGSQTGIVTDSATVSGGGETNVSNDTGTDTTNVRFSTSVTLTSSPSPSALGQSVTLSVSVSSGTGKVTFYDGASMIGVAPVTNGTATFATNLLPSGVRSLTARYDGDTNFGPMLSPVRTHTVTVNTVNSGTSKSYAATSVGTNDVVVADFNRDGKQDLVTANQNDITVFLGNGEGTFQKGVSYLSATGSFPRIAVADFNGDGYPDIAVTPGPASTIAILIGNGDGTFKSPVAVSGFTTDYLAGFAAGDLNGDGTADLVFLGATINVLLGNGDGTFQASLVNNSVTPSRGFWALADINGDGKLDLALAGSAYANPVAVLLGNGDGTFQPPISNAGYGNAYIMCMTAGDFNNDGRADVLEVYWVGAAVLKGNPDGTLQSPVSSPLQGGVVPDYNYAVAGDFNGDGKLDFAYRSYSIGGAMSIALGNGDGTFTTVDLIATDSGSGNIAVGDFNGDGKPDFVTANTGGTINVFLGGQTAAGLKIASTHAGTLTAGSTITYSVTVTNPAYATTSGNISVTATLPPGLTFTSNGGCNTVAGSTATTCLLNSSLTSNTSSLLTFTVQAAASLTPQTLAPQFSVTYNNTTTSVTDPTLIVYASSSSLALSSNTAALGQNVTMTATVTGLGSISGSVSFYDGYAYLGSATISGNQASLTTRLLNAGAHRIYALYTGNSTHSGSQSAPKSITVNAAQASGFSAPTSITTGAGPASLVTADFNSDGKFDFATANSTDNSVSVLLGNGDGTFQPKVDYPVGTGPVSLVVADLNGDGKADLVVANSKSLNLSILLGKGDGTFQGATTVPLNLSGTNLTLINVSSADFNGDGRPDLLLLDSSGTVTFWLGNGDGTFTVSQSSAFSSANWVSITDFNGDNKADIVWVSFSAIYTQLGNGDGTFAGAIYNYANYGGPFVTTADVNGDGVPDLLASDSGYSGVDVLLCKTSGICTMNNKTYTTSGTPAAIVTGDINGDGKIDIVAASKTSATVSVLLGNGDGTFQNQLPYSVGSVPSSLVVGDFNGDGRTDIAFTSAATGKITILLGSLNSVLQVTSTHTGNFLYNQTGATYTLTVTNNGPSPVTDTITLTDTLPAGLTATSISGSSWSCTLASLTCTISASNLGVGSSLPPITLTVNVTYNSDQILTNTVSVSSPNTVPGSALDSTSITALQPPGIVSPTAGQTAVPLSTSLVWSAAPNATSYDIYFGTASPPPLVNSTTGTSYSTSTLTQGTVYYWRVVSKNASGTATTPTVSFVTVAPPNYTGYIDSSSCAGISGWAADRNRPGTPITVTLWDGNTQIASTTANGARSDVGAVLGDNGLHGFTLTIPSSYRNGAPHTLQVRYESSSSQLPGSPVTLTCAAPVANYTGWIDSASCSGISGWAADRNRPNTSITVSLWLNGTQIASATANGVRSDVGAALGDNGAHSFTIPIPSSYQDGAPHAFQVFYESSATQLTAGASTTLTCGATTTANYAGWVDSASCSGITGWAADKNRPNTPITVTLWLNGTQVASTTANGLRSDVGAALGDNGAHAFALSIPVAYQDGVSHAFQVHYESSTSQLPGAATTLACGGASNANYAGWIDAASCSAGITGWAADKNRPNTPITVTLWLNGTQIASTTANGLRSDVGAALGDNGAHAFALSIPVAYQDGVSHAFQVHYETSASQLPGAATTLACGGASNANYAGWIESSSCSGISGWVADKNRLNTPITVSLWTNGTQIASATANGARPDVGTFLSDNGAHGFALPIPPTYQDGTSHTFQVRYESSATQVPGSPVSLTCNGAAVNYAGYLESATCSGFSGWAADKNRPGVSIAVSLWVDGTQSTTATANASRSDVGAVLGDNGLHGFGIPFPSTYQDGQSHTYQVRFENSATQIPRSPATFTCR